MGVPAFFRWLSLKYNRIVSHCVEEKSKRIDDNTNVPVDTSLPNPNDVEFDNLYLDMNGIIHPCTHPENKPAPKNEEEMFVEIFLYIDRIFSVVRPRRLIYMAVDGVAPRAKMNQQRSRRFRAGKETREKTLTLTRLREELLQKGAKLPDPKSPSEHFDSNCITPGTPFMARLALALQYYVYDKLNSDPGWSKIQVILSDASAPGEGEHKIMDFIRRQRASPTHDPNTKHCLCGADADLIMLGLATHEPYFTIIREEFKPNQPRPCELCGQMNHVMEECQGLASEEFNTGKNNTGIEAEFIFIHLNILREYLQHDLLMNNLPFEYNFERAIDDWVFMCFFVGNDFLPHLPSLEIREKAIDRLIELYKSSVYKTKGWLTDSGEVNLERVQLIMKDLALVEDAIFKSRRENEVDFRRKGKARRMSNKRQRLDDSSFFNNRNAEFVRPNMGEKFSKNSAIEASRNAMRETTTFNTLSRLCKRSFNDVDEEDIKNEELDKRDEVKLWEEGYRTRYYQSKFGVSVRENPTFCVNVAHQYVRGLCWVLAYYYQGCPSWTWYYPYHYAPFAEDFLNVANTDVYFSPDSEPFKPLEQLMGVFPADSKDHVPPAWHSLMTDSDSPVIDFYPTDFKVDLNGKRYDWQGVALLPFVDEGRLLSTLALYYDKLTDDEQARNVRGPDRYFVRSDHPIAISIQTLYEIKCDEHDSAVMEPSLVSGITGRIWRDMIAYKPGDTVRSAVKNLCQDIVAVKAVSCFYQDPQYTKQFFFPAILLPGVTMPPPALGPEALRIERENRDKRHFDRQPMNRMIRHSMPNKPTTQQDPEVNANVATTNVGRKYGPSPFYDESVKITIQGHGTNVGGSRGVRHSNHELLNSDTDNMWRYGDNRNSIKNSGRLGSNTNLMDPNNVSYGNLQRSGYQSQQQYGNYQQYRSQSPQMYGARGGYQFQREYGGHQEQQEYGGYPGQRGGSRTSFQHPDPNEQYTTPNPYLNPANRGRYSNQW